jgi:hypothetical protein
MAQVANVNHYNNLLQNTKRRAIGEYLEHKVARIPLDLSYKEQSPVYNIINAGVSQINGKRGDFKYKPDNEKHSRPDYSYDARIDDTILNAIRNRYVDVSGLLIANKHLKVPTDLNMTQRPLKTYGMVL